jgi:hypothetical protein
LVITGECAEDIYLHRDNTVFRSADPLNRANIKTQTKQINIFRSKDVSFEDITISNGFGGIAMFDQSLVDLNGVEITGNTVMGGVDVYNQSTAVIGSNNVLGPNGSAYAIGARNGSQVVVWSDNNAFNSSNTAWATIYLSGAGMGMWGNNIAVDGPFIWITMPFFGEKRGLITRESGKAVLPQIVSPGWIRAPIWVISNWNTVGFCMPIMAVCWDP